jgi:hypothetical protein
MKRAVVLLAASCMLLIAAGCNSSKSADGSSGGGSLLGKAASMVTQSDPWLAMMASNAARKKATSWRMRMEMSYGGKSMNSLSEVECPDRAHHVTDMGVQKVETYQVGDKNYMSMGGQWRAMPSHGALYECPGVERPHASMPSSHPSVSEPEEKGYGHELKEEDKAKYEIKKGAVITVEGEPCQQWMMSSKDPNDKLRNMTYCIGIADNLPRQVKSESMTITYWDWNKPLGIKAPI